MSCQLLSEMSRSLCAPGSQILCLRMHFLCTSLSLLGVHQWHSSLRILIQLPTVCSGNFSWWCCILLFCLFLLSFLCRILVRIRNVLYLGGHTPLQMVPFTLAHLHHKWSLGSPHLFVPLLMKIPQKDVCLLCDYDCGGEAQRMITSREV